MEEELTEEMLQEKELVLQEAKAQCNELLEHWGDMIIRFYHINNKELKINMGINLNGNNMTIKLRTTMSFATAKVTADTEKEISLQPILPGVDA